MYNMYVGKYVCVYNVLWYLNSSLQEPCKGTRGKKGLNLLGMLFLRMVFSASYATSRIYIAECSCLKQVHLDNRAPEAPMVKQAHRDRSALWELLDTLDNKD